MVEVQPGRCSLRSPLWCRRRRLEVGAGVGGRCMVEPSFSKSYSIISKLRERSCLSAGARFVEIRVVVEDRCSSGTFLRNTRVSKTPMLGACDSTQIITSGGPRQRKEDLWCTRAIGTINNFKKLSKLKRTDTEQLRTKKNCSAQGKNGRELILAKLKGINNEQKL